jgi:hypothetical protein
LYAGELSVGATPNRVVALHFGAFLDLAERMWSLDWRRASWRAERVKAEHDTIDVVLGIDAVMDLLCLEDDDAERPVPATWQLRDTSSSGLGAVLPVEAGWNVPLGALMAFRASGSQRWQLGCVVRRVRVPDASQWIIGIKRLSDAPLPVELQVVGAERPPEGQAPLAIYAPINADGGRIDGVVIDTERQPGSNELLLPTRGGAFHIRANRVMDRGERWVRVGFEVVAKR